MPPLNDVTSGARPTPLPAFGPGDQVRVWYRIQERGRVRVAPFEGIVVRRRGSGRSETFIVRRVTHGEGVERVFPVQAPVLERIEIVQHARTRRARLYYLRTKVGKTRIAAAKPSASQDTAQPAPAENPRSELPAAPPAA